MNSRLTRLSNQYTKAYWENLETKKTLKLAIGKLQDYLQKLRNKPIIFTGYIDEAADYDSEGTIDITWHEHQQKFVAERMWIRRVELVTKLINEEDVLVDNYSLHIWLSNSAINQGIAILYRTRWENVEQILLVGAKQGKTDKDSLEFV